MRMIWISMALLSACLLWFREAAAQDGRHVALVIGNSAYTGTSPLRNPQNDAVEMERLFYELGFSAVHRAFDADRSQMQEALKNFSALAAGADVAVIFYSGHGMELGDENYLIPINAGLRDEIQGRLESVPLQEARLAASRASRLSMVIVDACRNNIFPSSSRGSKGLAPVESSRPGEVILYATEPGKLAQDGDGPLSPFTQALTQSLRAQPDQDVRILASSVRLPGSGQTPFAQSGRMSPELVSLLASHLRRSPPPVSDACALADAPPGFRCVMREGRASFETLAAPSAQPAPAQQDMVAPPLALLPRPAATPVMVPPPHASTSIDMPSVDLAPTPGSPAAGYLEGALRGSAVDMRHLGASYDRGDYGAPPSSEEAVKWLQRGAELGDATSMLWLGHMYRSGRGVAQNILIAIELWRKAALAGNAASMYELGGVYRSGAGVARSYAQAMGWYREAAKSGHARSMAEIAYMYNNGLGVSEDKAQALEWYLLSAKAGNGGSMHQLAIIYELGLGTRRDPSQAAEWRRKAQENQGKRENLGSP